MSVDIDRILHDKNPAADRWLPGFVKDYLKRIVHESEINHYLGKYGHLPTIEFVRATLAEMGITYTAEGMDKLDRKGRYIFVSNHPFGGLDGLMLADKVQAYFGNVRVVVNDLLMNLTPLAPIFIPVNKHGKQNPEYVRLHNDVYGSDIPIITFPAGLCSRKRHGEVRDLEWKSRFVKEAVNNRRDIVPVYFEGHLSNFFYRLANLRTGLGIKANIEMFYLADEMFRQKGKHFKMVIGDPIPWNTLEGIRPAEVAADVREKVYEMGKKSKKERKWENPNNL